MTREALIIVRYLLALGALCVVGIVTLDILDRTDAEVLTILGTTLATIVGAVAGVVVGQRQPKPETPPVAIDHPQPGPAEVPLPAALALPGPGPTGPDTGARLGMYEALSADPADADGDGIPDARQIAAFLGPRP